jgi:sulfite reductase alpha subunit-like flavoprotein
MAVYDKLTITILYSTQSGRAKACARRSSRLLRSKYPSVVIHGNCSFDEYGVEKFLSLGSSCEQDSCSSGQKHLLLLFVSTTGDGEHTTSITRTWSALLSKSLPSATFSRVDFALFALGDRAYGDAFCAAGRKLATRLVQLGAEAKCVLGYGDDGSEGGVLGDLDGWLVERLFGVLDGLAYTKVSEGEMEVKKDTGDELLYSVEILSEGGEGDTEPLSDQDREMHEWQKKQYIHQYATYFQHSCPDTAYQYNEKCSRLTNEMRNNHSEQSVGTSHNINPRSPPLLGRVTVNDRITSDGWMQNTRHLRIHVTKKMDATNMKSSQDSNVTACQLPYQAGDVATILPSNPTSLVSKFLSVLPSSVRSIADKPLQIHRIYSQSCSINHPWPERCTLRGLLTHCADLQSLPEREDFYALSAYCNVNHANGKDQRDKLISLSETSEAALYADYIIRNKRNWVDLFYDFDSLFYEEDNGGDGRLDYEKTLVTISRLLGCLPSIAPRHFSIASAPSYIQINRESSVLGFEIELCVAVVEGTTPLGRSYIGCCSSYLAAITPSEESDTNDSTINKSDIVRLWITPGSFHNIPLTQSTDADSTQHFFKTPILCVGAGTGIAPLRSLLFEREAQRLLHLGQKDLQTAVDKIQVDIQLHDNILVFGCRKKSMDYYYGQEWDSLIKASRLRLTPAFSRDQEHKLYVQRALREMDGGAFIVQHILERGGAVYIAGGSKMVRAVKDQIVQALGSVLEGGDSDAKKHLNRLKRKGLFSIEAWS